MDFTQLPLDQIFGGLAGLAAIVFLAGFSKALVSATVAWRYAAQWIISYLFPVFVLTATAAVGSGVPALHMPPNPLVGVIFGLASAAFVVTCLTSIAANLGVDPRTLPRAKNADLAKL